MKLIPQLNHIMKNSEKIVISGVEIGENSPTYFVADIAANHDGDLGRAKELIYLAAESGADAAKFQHFSADTIVSDFGFSALSHVQSHQSRWNKSVFEVYREASVDLEWTQALYDTCKKAKIPFFTTPYSLGVIEFIDEYVPAYKIGSGDITWHELIAKVASKNKPYMIASGASSADEVYRAVEVALSINPDLILMQCNTNYTGDLENFKYIHLNVIKTFRNMYPSMVLGLSDHTAGHSTVLGAVALGARVIEKHFTDDINRVGPDHAFSMDPKSWREMVERTRELEAALGCGIKRVEKNERETLVLQRRALRASKNFDAGHIVEPADFVPLRPCPADALPLSNAASITGGVLKRKMLKGDYLKCSDID